MRGLRDAAPQMAAQVADRAESLFKDPFRLALLAFIVQTISKVASAMGPVARLRPALLLFGFCLFFAIAQPKKAWVPGLFKGTIPRLTLAQGVIACGSVLFGISLGHSANFILENYWKTLAYCWLLMASLRHVTDARRLVWAVTIAGFILAFLSVFVVGISKTQGHGAYDANDIGVIMVTTLPLALLLLQTSKGMAKLLLIAGMAVTMMTVVQSASRGAFVGTAVVGIALLVFTPGVSVLKRVGVIVGAAVAMMLAAPEGYWKTMQEIVTNPQSDYNWESYGGRRNIAKRGMGYMMQYPVFGVGINNFTFAEGQLSSKAREGLTNIRWSAPHNSFVQAGAETGITGLAVWIGILVVCAVGWWRARARMPSWWAKGAPQERFLYLSTMYVPIAFVGFAITATFVSFAWSDQYYVLPAIVVGLQKAFAHTMATSAPMPAAAPGPAVLPRRGGAPLRRGHA